MESEERKEKKRGSGRAFLLFVVLIVVSSILFDIVDACRMLMEQNRGLQQRAKISLNEAFAQNQPLPVGEYVSFDTRWVFGRYATNTYTYSLRNRKNQPLKEAKKEKYYYLVVADDLTLMTVATTNLEEIHALDSLVEQTELQISEGELSEEGDSILLQGNLVELDDSDIKDILVEVLDELGLSADSDYVRYLVLDTDSGRDHVIYKFFGVLIVGMIAYFAVKENKRYARERQRREAARQVKSNTELKDALEEEDRPAG